MSKEHLRLHKMLEKSNTPDTDIERLSLFYILCGNDDLYEKITSIYNFQDNSIIYDCLENNSADFSGSSKSLILLAFNLFNGHPADINQVFHSLDSRNAELAINAIKLRYGIG